MKSIFKIMVFIIVAFFATSAFSEVNGRSNWARRGLTGGNPALDGVTGYAIGPEDVAYSVDVTGNTAYVHAPQDTGVTNIESSPYVITPDSLQPGGEDATGGTTTWRLVDSYVSRFDCWELQVQGVRWDDGSGGMKESVVRSAVTTTTYDKATDNLDMITDGTTYKLITAAKKTVLDNTSGTNTGDDDVPEAGDFAAGTDFDLNGALNTDSVSANELDATGVEAELEAVLDHDELQNITANDHLDWTASVGTIHTGNYIEGGAGTDTTAARENRSGVSIYEAGSKEGTGVSNVNFDGTDFDVAVSPNDYATITIPYVDQDVTSGANPTLAGANLTALKTDNLVSGTCTSPTNTQLNAFIVAEARVDQDVIIGSNPTFGTPTISNLTGTAVIDATNLNFTSTGGVTLSAVSAVVITANIFNPDDVYSGVSEFIAIYKVDADKFPAGIILDSIMMNVIGATSYAVDIEEWIDSVNQTNKPVYSSNIEAALTIAAGAYEVEVRNTNIDDRDIAADSWIFIDLPSTLSQQLFIKIKGRIK